MHCHFVLKYTIMCACLGLHFILIKNPFLVVYSIANFRIYHTAKVRMRQNVSKNWQLFARSVLLRSLIFNLQIKYIESKNWINVDGIYYFKPVAINWSGMLTLTHSLTPSFLPFKSNHPQIFRCDITHPHQMEKVDINLMQFQLWSHNMLAKRRKKSRRRRMKTTTTQTNAWHFAGY